MSLSRVAERRSQQISRRRLERALDPGAMRQLFERRLPSTRDGASRVVECSIQRLRQGNHDGPRAIVEYVLRLEERATGTQRTERAAGTIYPGALQGRTPARRAMRELGTLAPAPSVDDRPEPEPYFLIPELRMLVQVFPFDHRLPGLATLATGTPPELGPALTSRFGPGDWRLEGSTSELVRYVSGTRATFRLTALARDSATGRVASRRFYAKMHRSGRKARRRYARLTEVAEGAAATRAGFAVPRPVALFEDLQAILLEEVPGTPLRALVMGDGDVGPPARSAGAGLAALHLSELSGPPGERAERRSEELVRTGAALRRTLSAHRREIDEVVEGVATGIENEGEAPLAPTHRDLHLDHMLLDGPRLGLVDLDEFGTDDPLHDVLRVLLSLSAAQARADLPPARALSAQREFIAAYHARVPGWWSERLPARYAETLLRRAATVTLEPGDHYGEDASVLVHQARRSLSGRMPWDE